MEELKNKVSSFFEQSFGELPDLFVRAPGRINLIGEHTDYNLGLALPAAIDKSIIFAFKSNGTNICNIKAIDINDKVSISLNSLVKSERLWVNYMLGVLREFKKRGVSMIGFDCAFSGNIPIGSGLSSSAALDCGFILGVSRVFNEALTPWEVVTISNVSNNDFLNIKSGILDQFASVFGKDNKCILLDCRTKEYQYYDLCTGDYSIVLINTKVKHENLSSGYNDRPAECQDVIKTLKTKYPFIQSLRDISSEMLSDSKSLITNKLYQRTKFILEENKRVEATIKALENRDFNLLGRLLYESHYGLQTLYEVSCKELDLLVSLAKSHGVLGSRMMGGGFGGCTLNLIQTDGLDKIVNSITNAYYENTNVRAEFYKVKIGDGVMVYES